MSDLLLLAPVQRLCSICVLGCVLKATLSNWALWQAWSTHGENTSRLISRLLHDRLNKILRLLTSIFTSSTISFATSVWSMLHVCSGFSSKEILWSWPSMKTSWHYRCIRLFVSICTTFLYFQKNVVYSITVRFKICEAFPFSTIPRPNHGLISWSHQTFIRKSYN